MGDCVDAAVLDEAGDLTVRRSALAAAACVACAAGCGGPAPVVVSVGFHNSWTIGGVPFSELEQRRVREIAVDTLRAAFSGFDVRVAEGVAASTNHIVVEDTPYSAPMYFSGVGLTRPTAAVSSVRVDGLLGAELSVLGCESILRCSTKTRHEMVAGLGVGIGATAAHELGHQRGLGFTHHASCDDCYDSVRSASYAHFFGRKHWSTDSLRAMRAVLRPVARPSSGSTPGV